MEDRLIVSGVRAEKWIDRLRGIQAALHDIGLSNMANEIDWVSYDVRKYMPSLSSPTTEGEE